MKEPANYSWATHKIKLKSGFVMYFDGIDEAKEWVRRYGLKKEDVETVELKAASDKSGILRQHGPNED